MVVQARSSSDASCPYCRGAFEPGERVLACEACQTAYHEECMRQELGRCSTLGCAGKRALLRGATGAAPIEVSVRPAPERPLAATSGPRSGGRILAFLASGGTAVAAGVFAMFLVAELTSSTPSPVASIEALIFMVIVAAAALMTAVYVASAPVHVASVPVTYGRCATCAAAFSFDERLLVCEGCAGQHHPACLRRLGRCAGATCTGRRAVPGRARAR